MKLLDHKILSDGTVMLKNGFYLEPIPSQNPNFFTWSVRRLMDDAPLGTATLTDLRFARQIEFSLGVGDKHGIPYRLPASDKMHSTKRMYEAFYAWCELEVQKVFKEDIAPIKATTKRLNEAKILDDGTVMLKNGFYLEPDKNTSDPFYCSWTVHRLMADHRIGEAWLLASSHNSTDTNYTLGIWLDGEERITDVCRAPSIATAKDPLYSWLDKKLAEHTLAESKVTVSGDITMIGDGFYLEKKPVGGIDDEFTMFTIKRLMQDDEVLGTCAQHYIDTSVNAKVKGSWICVSGLKRHTSEINDLAELHSMQEFGKWVRDQLRVQLKEDLFADSRKARQNKANLLKPVYLRRLNKDGSESGMRDATTFHQTEEEAKIHHDRLVKNNPRAKIAHHMYSYNGDETFKTKLVAGKIVPLKGGIAGGSEDDLLADAVHDFIQMLDDEGSAAGMWMPWAKKMELYKLYRAKYKIKSVGVYTDDMSDVRAATKVKKKIDSLESKGWKLFMQEENGEYVDMVFTKAP